MVGFPVSNTETAVEPFDAPETVTEDPEMLEVERTVTEPGVPGEREVTYSVTRVNGIETERVRGAEKVLTEAEPAAVTVGDGSRYPEAPWFADPFVAGNRHGVITLKTPKKVG